MIIDNSTATVDAGTFIEGGSGIRIINASTVTLNVTDRKKIIINSATNGIQSETSSRKLNARHVNINAQITGII